MDRLQVHIAGIYRPGTLAGYMFLAVVTGAVAGIYPSVFLSSAQPRSLLNRRSAISAGRFRSLLVVFQFSVSISLIVATIVIFRQFDYMRKKELGFDADRVLVAQIVDNEIRNTYRSVRKRLMEHNGAAGVAFTSHQPGRHARLNVFSPEGHRIQEMQRMDVVSVDEGFVPTMGIGLAAGHNFASDPSADNRRAVLINLTAARQFGWSNSGSWTMDFLSITGACTSWAACLSSSARRPC